MSTVTGHALLIGSQVATISDETARCLSMVMQSVDHEQYGVLESAIREARTLELSVLKLQDLLVDLQAEMQK